MLGGPTEGWDEQEVIIVEEKDEYFTSSEIMTRINGKDLPHIDLEGPFFICTKGKIVSQI